MKTTQNMLSYTHGTKDSLLPYPPYYWWESGAMFGSLIDYWYYTGDDRYNNLTSTGLLSQVGSNQDYQPADQYFDLGNDDQAFWGMAVLSAAEYKFPNPPKDQPQWLALAQAVFNTQAAVWDSKTCGGGLHWQKESVKNGYNYKNTISNGAFFNIAARLALYTSNKTYSDWAEKAYDWMNDVGVISQTWQVFDGTWTDNNCTSHNPLQYTYNHGIIMYGAATMFNYVSYETRKQNS